MKKYLALHNPKLQKLFYDGSFNLAFAKECRIKGLNAYYFDLNIFWSYFGKQNYTFEQQQNFMVDYMYKVYLMLIEIGYEYFIVNVNYGLGFYDNNYFYQKIYEKFKNCDNVLFECSETYEDYVETKKIGFVKYCKIITQKINLIGKHRLTIGSTARNKKFLRADSLTSYLFQEHYWEPTDKLAWIYGQFCLYHFFSSLWYKSHNRKLDKLGIQIRILYQGDDYSNLTWEPNTWFNYILKKLNLQDKIKNYLFNRFVKIFK